MHSNSLLVTLIQSDIIWESPKENIKHLDALLNQSAESDLIILPEMWSTGFTMNPETYAEPAQGPALQWMKMQSKRKNAVIAGSVSVMEENRYFNRCYVVYPDGHVMSYDKRHLFSYGKEDQHYTAGLDQVTIDVKGWKIRPVICYDLRFPVWCRNTDDYDVLAVMANWPEARVHHWDAMLKSRAIENQCFVAAVNRTGKDGNGLVYNGHTCIYDMNGTSVINLGENENIATVELSKTVLNQFRQQFRFLQDRDQFSLNR